MDNRGFTLIELLVVIAVLAIAVAGLTLRGFSHDGGDAAVARLRLLLETAADRAAIVGAPIAVDFEPGGYRFSRLDGRGQWQLIGRGDVLAPRQEPHLKWIDLSIAGARVAPRLVFSGDMPDFRLRVAAADGTRVLGGRVSGRVVLESSVEGP
jgi:type II secretion system protein H